MGIKDPCRCIPLKKKEYFTVVDIWRNFNSSWLNNAIRRHMWVNIGSSNGFLSDGARPLLNVNLPWILWHSPKSNFTRSAQDINPCNEFENYIIVITATSIRGQWVNVWWKHTSLCQLKPPTAFWIVIDTNLWNNIQWACFQIFSSKKKVLHLRCCCLAAILACGRMC